MKRFVYMFFILWFVFANVSLNVRANQPVVAFDKNFMYALSTARAIERDMVFAKPLNTIVRGWGVIISYDKKSRYKRSYRLILEDKNAATYKLNITYNVFFNKEETISLLTEGDDFEFRGQLMSYVSVNTARSAYIIDIVLEEGTIILE